MYPKNHKHLIIKALCNFVFFLILAELGRKRRFFTIFLILKLKFYIFLCFGFVLIWVKDVFYCYFWIIG